MEEIRKEFVLAAKNSSNFSAVCREFDITRKTGRKWVERYDCGECLSDRSRRPLHSPNKTPLEIEALILQVRRENPGWGAKTIHKVLENEGIKDLPCARTVNNILRRNGCISREESLKRRPCERFEKDNCNDMWQTDFKGEFLLGDGSYCFPLDIIDDHSRFLIKIKACPNTKNVVISTFKSAFEEYGMPKAILSDNGAQFAGFRKGFTQFEKWLMCLDILPVHGRIKHPQTQGKIERFHRTLKNELLDHTTFENIEDADVNLQLWREKYNNIRPHEALNMQCPGRVYTPSSRIFTEKIPAYEYGGEYHVIKVNSWGYVRFDRWQVFLSETMAGEYIEFRPNPLGDSFFGCFRNFKIAEFDSNTGVLINRNIFRL